MINIKASDIKKKLVNLSELYIEVSKLYYLPKMTSRVITRAYLWTLVTSETAWAPPANCVRHKFHFQGRGSEELLGYLDKIVTQKNLKLGFAFGLVPNIKWIKRSILHIEDGTDKLGLLGTTTKNFRLSEQERETLVADKIIAIKPEYH